MNDAIYSVSCNAWMRAALCFAAKFFITGLAWSWLFPAGVNDSRRKEWQWLIKPVESLVCGVLICLLSALVLAQTGVYTPGAEALVLVLISLMGVGLGLRRAKSVFLRHLCHGLPAVIVIIAGMAIIMHLPARGEWVLGGLDPGVYINQGVQVERTGTFKPVPAGAYVALTRDEQEVFTRGTDDYTECFPGIPLDPETVTYQPYFFRLTPTLVATVARCGGLRAATRVNTFVGALMLTIFFAGMLVNTRHISWAVFATIILAAQPVWIYHLHEPTSEMLHLLLMCSLFLFLPVRRNSAAGSVMVALLLFVLMLNRLSFLPFGGLVLIALAWLDRGRADRASVLRERIAQILALGAGLFFDLVVTSITIVRLKSVVPMLVMVGGGFAVVALFVDLLAGRDRIRRWMLSIPRGVGLGFSVVTVVFILFVLCVDKLVLILPFAEEAIRNARALQPFFGNLLILYALLGGVLLYGAGDRDKVGRVIRGFLLILLGATAILVLNNYVKFLFPWATRRYLPYTVPALAILGGYLCSWLWEARGSLRLSARIVSVLLLCVLLGSMARRAWHAWSRTEYNGISAALASVAEQIEPADIVVADHPWWGTPLAFIHGKQVLNGKRLWAGNDREWAERGLRALQRLDSEGRNILFLTSTPGGLSVYPAAVTPATLLWEAEPLAFEEIIQHRKAIDFELRHKQVVFKLFKYSPEI